MNKNLIKQICECIKTNNVNQFSVLLKQEDFLHVCFGRFPLLSVLYLFNSTKIIKKYEKYLINISEYKKINEISDFYLKFKEKSGRVLRLYSSEVIVSPYEMLLILNQTYHLKYVYKKYGIVDEKIIKNLQQIEKININEQLIFTSKNIKIKRRFLNNSIKKLILYSFALIFVCCAVAMLTAKFTFNLGTEQNPLTIYNATQLKMALDSSNKYYAINKDITISLSKSYNCASVINGNGNTITIKSSKSTIFNKFSGKISNANIVLETNKTINKSYSFFADKNNGEIDNINFNLISNITINSGGDAICGSAFVGDNNNKISNCKIFTDVRIEGTQHSDSFFACVASNNNSKIINCEVINNSEIYSNTSDICGIVAQNNADGIIDNCQNYAKLTQTTGSSSWSPNVAGINLINYGKVQNCENFGNLSINISAQGAGGENVSEGYCAGITAINYKKIEHCKNNANITIENTFYNVYAGGIVALNYFNSTTGELSQTFNCGFSGTIQLTDNSESHSYIGGIAGCSIGEVRDCYANLEFGSTENIKTGGIIGLTHYGIGYNSIFGFVYVTDYTEWYENNYFYISNSITNKVGIAGILPNTSELTDVGMNICSTTQDLENCEVFW